VRGRSVSMCFTCIWRCASVHVAADCNAHAQLLPCLLLCTAVLPAPSCPDVQTGWAHSGGARKRRLPFVQIDGGPSRQRAA
jgi:hypothetical protein